MRIVNDAFVQRNEMKELFPDKLKIHIETLIGDVEFDDINCVIGKANRAETSSSDRQTF